jgi:carbamate kinase
MTKKVVIALGGNAIQEAGKPATAETQLNACRQTAVSIVDILESGYEVVVAHGNGPQVGNIVLQNEAAHSDKTPAMPFDVCGAMSQGEIGYWLQQSIGDELRKRGRDIPVCTVVTQVTVDREDSAFKNPTKPIGPFYTEEAARKIADEKGYVMKEDAGRGWRRVVASPMPVDVVEKEAIKKLVESGILTIAVGGGGIPVVVEGGRLKGVAAVIDKDLGSEKLAEILDADILMILTAVEKVSINYNKPNQMDIDAMTVEEAEKYMVEGHFAPGSMLPKVKAAVKFVVSKENRTCVITSLESAAKALRGQTGTTVK